MTTSAIVAQHVLTQEFRTPVSVRRGILAGQVGLAVLVGANGAVLPATIGGARPVACAVYRAVTGLQHCARHPRRYHADGGGWLVERSGVALAPAVYLAVAAAVTFTASLLLPRAAPHRLTKEFQATRLR